jgi:zinc finger protein AEBP2
MTFETFVTFQIKHVISQATQEQYVCLWLGCKVHGRTSCSRSWLERHVLAHAGTKPFRCIVDGCGQRFNSQLTLERHVNGHFTSDGGQNGSAKKSTDSSSAKLFKRNGKKIRFRRQPWSGKLSFFHFLYSIRKYDDYTLEYQSRPPH